MLKYVIFSILFAFSTQAQNVEISEAKNGDNTVVFGESTNADGTENEVLLVQPQNAPNPLGNPIVAPPAVPENTAPAEIPAIITPQKSGKVTVQNSLQNPLDSQMTPEQMNNEIQNKLYQEGNRVYDIQSYPADDLQTINQNGQDEAVTNYPSY